MKYLRLQHLKRRQFVSGLLITGLLTTAVAQKVDSNDDANQPRPTLTVSVTTPSSILTQDTVTATGDIAAKEMATVTAQVSALTLNRILVDVGDYVEKGQLLATYDAASVQNDIAQAKATLKQAQITAAQATKNAKRIKRLGNTSALSNIERDDYLFQAQRQQANVAAAQAVLDNQRLRASYANVTAPVSGLITEKQAVLGAVGNPGTLLFSLIVDGELEWFANVPERTLAILQPAMPVEIAITAGDDTVHVAGKIRSIDPVINPETRQGVVRVSLEKHPILRQGLFVTGKFILGEKSQLSLPTASIVRKDSYSYVFKIGTDNRVERIKVEVGQVSGNSIAIVSGIRADDQIVSTGVGFLSHGDWVKIVLPP